MRKSLALLLLALVASAASPTPTQVTQSATKEPDVLTRAMAEFERISEAQSIEKNKQSVLKIRNSIRFQATFDAIKSETSFKQFEWPGFYEFRNPGDKPVVITDFRVTTGSHLFGEKLVRAMTRSKPDKVEAFGNLDDKGTSQEIATIEPTALKFPITIPPHTTQYLKIHLFFDVSDPNNPLQFDDEDEANKWLSAAIGLRQNPDGYFRCLFTNFPIEVSTADHKVLQYDPYTVLIVPGCSMRLPVRPQ